MRNGEFETAAVSPAQIYATGMMPS